MLKKCLILVGAVAFAACSDAPTTVEPEATVETPEVLAEKDNKDVRTYKVTVYNLTKGQPFTPPAAGTHKSSTRVWRNNQPASEGVKEIAENGNTAPLLAALEANPEVDDVVMASGPIFPGDMLEFTITAQRGFNKISFVSMLICTNDGFTGLNSFRLPRWVGDYRTRYIRGKDAGTEINTESFSDLVPPCPAITGIETDEMGTGMSNPDLAENGVIRPHRNIRGIDDLLRSLHRWRGPVAKVVVKRIS